MQELSFRRTSGGPSEHGKTLMIHDRDAHDDILRVLDDEGLPGRVVMHCFSGDADFARRCVERGAFLSFPGVVTFGSAGALRDAALATPLDRILVETDAPYLTPKPCRGKANAPYLLPHTVGSSPPARRRVGRSSATRSSPTRSTPTGSGATMPEIGLLDPRRSVAAHRRRTGPAPHEAARPELRRRPQHGATDRHALRGDRRGRGAGDRAGARVADARAAGDGCPRGRRRDRGSARAAAAADGCRAAGRGSGRAAGGRQRGRAAGRLVAVDAVGAGGEPAVQRVGAGAAADVRAVPRLDARPRHGPVGGGRPAGRRRLDRRSTGCRPRRRPGTRRPPGWARCRRRCSGRCRTSTRGWCGSRRDPPVTTASREQVFAVVDAAFSQRRKMLRAALSGITEVGGGVVGDHRAGRGSTRRCAARCSWPRSRPSPSRAPG